MCTRQNSPEQLAKLTSYQIRPYSWQGPLTTFSSSKFAHFVPHYTHTCVRVHVYVNVHWCSTWSVFWTEYNVYMHVQCKQIYIHVHVCVYMYVYAQPFNTFEPKFTCLQVMNEILFMPCTYIVQCVCVPYHQLEHFLCNPNTLYTLLWLVTCMYM